MICLNWNASFPQVHTLEKLLWLMRELCPQHAKIFDMSLGPSVPSKIVKWINPYTPPQSLQGEGLHCNCSWMRVWNGLASSGPGFCETGVWNRTSREAGAASPYSLSRHKRQASVSQTNIPLTSAEVCVSLTCSQCSNLHRHVGCQGGFFGSVQDSGEKHLRTGHLHNSVVKSRLEYQAPGISWYADGAPWLLFALKINQEVGIRGITPLGLSQKSRRHTRQPTEIEKSEPGLQLDASLLHPSWR